MSKKINRVGETRIMTNGMKATIIEYRTSTDIDVKFADGTIRKHVRYPHFRSGKVNPIYVEERAQNDKNKRIGGNKNYELWFFLYNC